MAGRLNSLTSMKPDLYCLLYIFINNHSLVFAFLLLANKVHAPRVNWLAHPPLFEVVVAAAAAAPRLHLRHSQRLGGGRLRGHAGGEVLAQPEHPRPRSEPLRVLQIALHGWRRGREVRGSCQPALLGILNRQVYDFFGLAGRALLGASQTLLFLGKVVPVLDEMGFVLVHQNRPHEAVILLLDLVGLSRLLLRCVRMAAPFERGHWLPRLPIRVGPVLL